MLVKQSSWRPTRKLSAATVGGAAVAVAGLVLRNLLPSWYDPGVMLALTPIVVFGLGYLTHDEDNTPEQNA